MLHSFKRATIGSLAVRGAGHGNGQGHGHVYESLCARLSVIQRTLQESLSCMDSLNVGYDTQMKATERLFASLHSNYPGSVSSSRGAHVIREALDGARGISLMFGKDLMKPSGGYMGMVGEVRRYVSEIKGVLGGQGCGKVETLHTDMLMYSQKVQRLDKNTHTQPNAVQKLMQGGAAGAQDANAAKHERNVSKLENVKNMYQVALEQTTKAMENLCVKAPRMYHVLFKSQTNLIKQMCEHTQTELNPVFAMMGDDFELDEEGAMELEDMRNSQHHQQYQHQQYQHQQYQHQQHQHQHHEQEQGQPDMGKFSMSQTEMLPELQQEQAQAHAEGLGEQYYAAGKMASNPNSNASANANLYPPLDPYSSFPPANITDVHAVNRPNI